MFCAIDFGTSNSAIAIPGPGHKTGTGTDRDRDTTMQLVELEAGHVTMPTAVFYFAPTSGAAEPAGPPRAFGRAAVAAYVDGLDGRLMRSMKSILGSSLIDQTTDAGGGRGVKYLDVVAGYLKHLKTRAEAQAGAALQRAVIGRPVFFVDDDPQRDAQAQAALETAARQVGFDDIHFQYEPIAAAFAYERSVRTEQIVLVADIGGGTSDFSVVRVGPLRAARIDRKADILANHGVHVAGTDFDRRVELAAILPAYGYGGFERGLRLRVAQWVVVDEEDRPADHGAVNGCAGLRFGARLQVLQVAGHDVEVLHTAAPARIGGLVDQRAAEDALHRAHQPPVQAVHICGHGGPAEGARRAGGLGRPGGRREVEHRRRHRHMAGFQFDQLHGRVAVAVGIGARLAAGPGDGDGGVGGAEVDGAEHAGRAAAE